MSIEPILFVLLILAMSAVPLVAVVIILFFAFDETGEDRDAPTTITDKTWPQR